MQSSIPSTTQFEDYPPLSRQALAGCVSVARVRPRTSKGITDLLLPHFPPIAQVVPLRACAHQTWTPATSGRGLARYHNKVDNSHHELKAAMHHHPNDHETSLVCQSYIRLDLVSFPVLSQIKTQATLLVVPFRQFL